MYLKGNEMTTLSEAIDNYLVHLASLSEEVKCWSWSKDIIPYNGHFIQGNPREGVVCLKGMTTYPLILKSIKKYLY